MAIFSVDSEKALGAIKVASGADLNQAIGQLAKICSEKHNRLSSLTHGNERAILLNLVEKLNKLSASPMNETEKLRVMHDLTLQFLADYDKHHRENNKFKKGLALFVENIYLSRPTQILQPNVQLMGSAMVRRGQEQFNIKLNETKKERMAQYKIFPKMRAGVKGLTEVKTNLSGKAGEAHVANMGMMAELGVMLMPIMEYMVPQDDAGLIMQHKTQTEKFKSYVATNITKHIAKKTKKYLTKRLGINYENAASSASSKESAQALGVEIKSFVNTVKSHLIVATDLTGRNYIPKDGEADQGAIDFEFNFNQMFHLMYDKFTTINLSQPLEMLESINILNDLLKQMLSVMLTYHPNSAMDDDRNLLSVALDGNEHLFALFQSITHVIAKLEAPEVPETAANKELFTRYQKGIGDLKATVKIFDDELNKINEQDNDVFVDAPEQQDEVFEGTGNELQGGQIDLLDSSSWVASISNAVTGTMNVLSNVGNYVASAARSVSQTANLAVNLVTQALDAAAKMSDSEVREANNFASQYGQRFIDASGLQGQIIGDVMALQTRLENMAMNQMNLAALIHPILNSVDMNAAQRAISLYERFFKRFQNDPKAIIKLSPSDQKHFMLNLVSMVHNLAALSDGIQQMLEGLMKQKDFIQLDPELTDCMNNLIDTLAQLQTLLIPHPGFIAEASDLGCRILPKLIPGLDEVIPENARTPQFMQGKKPMDVMREDLAKISNNMDKLPRLEQEASQTRKPTM